MQYVITATNPTAGRVEVLVTASNFTSGGTSLASRARMVRPGYGQKFKTKRGAEQALERVRAAVSGDQRWGEYTLAIEERAELPKPRKWNRKMDATRCVECGHAFRPGQLVYEDAAVNIHRTCLEAYRETMKKLGLPPK
jgi:hypothetical protein